MVMEPDMTEKHYADLSGNYLGVFVDGAKPSVECAEVYSSPAYAPTKAQQEALRQAAYASESDPIFFMAQRGEATVEEWTAKVAEIKARYPYPTEEV